MKKLTLSILGMHCTSCAFNIDGELEDTEGVKEASTNYATQKTKITFDERVIQEKELIEVIQKVGYKAVVE